MQIVQLRVCKRTTKLWSQANQGVFQALLQPGDTILGMSLDGGHQHTRHQTNQANGLTRFNMACAAKTTVLIMTKSKPLPKNITQTHRRWFSDPTSNRPQAYAEIADMVGAYLHVDMAHLPVWLQRANTSCFHMRMWQQQQRTTRRSTRGMILTNDEALAKKFNSAIFPGIQGGPLMSSQPKRLQAKHCSQNSKPISKTSSPMHRPCLIS